MGLHLAMFTGSVANGSTFTKLDAYQTIFENVQNHNLIVPSLNQILAVHAYGANMSRAELQAPDLQSPGYPQVSPINTAVPSNSVEAKLLNLMNNPLKVTSGEQLSAYVINGGSASEQEFMALLLADKQPTPEKKAFRTLRLTGSTTLTANEPVNCTMTFDDNLPVGTYDVIGARARSAGAIYFRLGHTDVPTRPGGVAVQSVDAEGPEIQRYGNLGVWFSFTNLTQIVMELLSTSADTAEYLELDVVGPK